MRVKRLEIQGFKSFKDKTVIHFDHSITGIVGPNGCGKSNIVDAFFWVMGEQSYKHMRGTGSEDLIFNGSSKYSPLGLAEATLVMETDYDTENAASGATAKDIPLHLRSKEISVTRRVYRSGEGEYFINGVPARLKDIQELFMDTGVGAKGYSVIEQGQIGKIVNAKPEERRLLIEEAAGIAKYKARKKESLRKMEATNLNLSRLNDIIQEIERSLGSLERQAQKAKQYTTFKADLLDKEMTWGRRKSLVLGLKLAEVKAKRDALEQELAGLRAELQVAENSIETDRVAQLTYTKTAEDLQLTIQDLASDLAREKSSLDLSRRRQGDLSTQLESLEAEQSELTESISIEKELLVSYETESKSATSDFEAATRAAQTMNDDVRVLRQNTESSRRQLDAAKRELMNGIAQASDLNSRGAALASRMESARAQAEKLSSQVQALTEKVAVAQEESERTRKTSAEMQSKKAALQSERKEQATLTESYDQSLRKLSREQDDSHRNLTKLKSRLQSLEELAQAHEGFGDGPKAALDWAKASGLDGTIKAIADGLDVGAGYEAALEGWLEGKLENLSSESTETGLAVLQQLQSEKQGRASVHISPEMNQNTQKAMTSDFSEAKDILETSGFEVLGELTQFISVNDKLGTNGQKTAAQLIANVCVVRNFSPLNGFISQKAHLSLGGWSIVSLDGSAFDQNGTLRGGSAQSDQGASLLGRKRAITELEEQVSAAEAKHSTLEIDTVAAKETLELARAKLQALQTDLQSLEVQTAAMDRDVHQANRTLRDSERALELAQIEMTDMQEEAQSATRDRMAIEEKLSHILAGRSDLEARIAADETEVTSLDTELRTKETELNALRIHEASFRERSSSLKRELEAGLKLVSDRERRLAEVIRILDRASSERAEHTGGDSERQEKIEDLTRTLAEARAKLSEVKDHLEKCSAKLNGALEKIKHLHHTGDNKTAEANSFALEVEKLSSDMSHLKLNLEEKYGPNCLELPVTSPIQEEMTAPVVTTEMSAEEEQILGEEVERLRERIRRLGEVNVMAIQEYEELKKRYDYLLTERSDLNQSIENLQDAIEHINKTSEERFKKAFDAIADRFERLFPIIFGGGQAKITLVYPEGSSDILEAGVDILAQPPGKKVVNITLLSGGEKALTAVSLIFAIFMVKPSPFCVLDEVDAPLDDANIGKFNALLREMSVKSQFILITHNKKTMELNDTLYGVTMEEPGVSKMVSIEMH